MLYRVAVRLTGFPLGLEPLVVASSPGVSPDLPGDDVLVGQEGREAALEEIGVAAYGVRGVAVVRALAVEAQVTCRTHEEGLEDVPVGHLVYLRGHVQQTTCYRHAPPEAHQPEEEDEKN